jgi:hypothetical protein
MTTPTPAALKAAQAIVTHLTQGCCGDDLCAMQSHLVDELKSEIGAIIDRHVGAWLPIEEYPDTQPTVVVRYKYDTDIAWKEEHKWFTRGWNQISYNPTHFMEIPPL